MSLLLTALKDYTFCASLVAVTKYPEQQLKEGRVYLSSHLESTIQHGEAVVVAAA